MASCAQLSLDKVRDFHNIDRIIYCRLLALDLDPFPAMKLVAFWNTLEKFGFRNLVYGLQGFSDSWLVSLVKESIFCLQCLYSPSQHIFPWLHLDFPHFNKLLSQHVLLGFLVNNRALLKWLIQCFVKDVCQVAFLDILQQNSARKQPHSLGDKGEALLKEPHSLDDEGEAEPHSLGDKGEALLKEPHSLGDKGVALLKEPLSLDDKGEVFKGKTELDEKTLFMTFSRGHPVSDQELHGFIAGKLGVSVKAIYMDKNPKCLFACVALRSHSDIRRILGGNKLLKLFINGKQVRVRRFVPKH